MCTGGSVCVSCPMQRPPQMSELQYRNRNKGRVGVNRRAHLISPPSLQIFIPGTVAWRSSDTPASYLRSETERWWRGVSRENGIRVMEAVPWVTSSARLHVRPYESGMGRGGPHTRRITALSQAITVQGPSLNDLSIRPAIRWQWHSGWMARAIKYQTLQFGSSCKTQGTITWWKISWKHQPQEFKHGKKWRDYKFSMFTSQRIKAAWLFGPFYKLGCVCVCEHFLFIWFWHSSGNIWPVKQQLLSQ